MGFRNLFMPCLEGEGNAGAGGGTGAAGSGGTGGTGAGGTGAGAAGGGGAAGAGSGTGNPWFSGFKSEDARNYVKSKNFQDPESLAVAYQNLEKVRGVPAERLLTIPEKADDPAWNDVHARLGRPEKADGYTFEVPEGASPDFAKAAQAEFHKLGLTKAQGESLAKWWNESAKSAAEAEKAQVAGNRTQQVTKLKTEWGAAFEQNANEVEAVALASGLTKEQVAAAESALGVDGFAKMIFQFKTKFGVKLGEAGFEKGSGGSGDFGGVMTPAQAKAERERLQSDPAFMKAWTSGGKKEAEQISRLYSFEIPTENAV